MFGSKELSVESAVQEEVQPLVERAAALRKYIMKLIKPIEDSAVARFVALPQESFAGDQLKNLSEGFKHQTGSILAEVALTSTQLPLKIVECSVDFDKQWKEAVKAAAVKLKGIKDEYPPLVKGLLPLNEAAKKVDSALGKVNREEKKVAKSKKKSVDLTKLEQLKREASESVIDMENLKDTFKADLQNYIGREHECTKMLCDLVELQRKSIQRAADAAKENLDQLENKIRSNPNLFVYKLPLQQHLMATRKEIAVPIEVCCSIMYQIGTTCEGLLRIPGKASKIKAIVAAFNYEEDVDWNVFADSIHSIGGALKQYLRDLPEPLLTFDLHNDWLTAMRRLRRDPSIGLQQVLDIVHELPPENYNNLRYLVKFLDTVVKNADQNKMTAENLATVIGPNLLWPVSGTTMELDDIPHRNMIVEVLLANHDHIFPSFAFKPTIVLKGNPSNSYIHNQNSNGIFSSGAVSEAVFGVKLEEHLQETGREIASVIEECCSVMFQLGLQDSVLCAHGNVSKVKQLRVALNNQRAIDWNSFADDVHSIGDAMKQYLRVLPEPLMTFRLYDVWISAAKSFELSKATGEVNYGPIREALAQLSPANFNNLRYLIKFLAEVVFCTKKLEDVAKVMGPHLLYPDPSKPLDPHNVHMPSLIVKFLVQHHAIFFPAFHFTPLTLLREAGERRPSEAVVDADPGPPAALPPKTRLEPPRGAMLYPSLTPDAISGTPNPFSYSPFAAASAPLSDLDESFPPRSSTFSHSPHRGGDEPVEASPLQVAQLLDLDASSALTRMLTKKRTPRRMRRRDLASLVNEVAESDDEDGRKRASTFSVQSASSATWEG